MGYTPPSLEVRRITGAYNVIAPSSTSTDDLMLYPNTVDTYSNITLSGNGGILLSTTAGNAVAVLSEATPVLYLYLDTTDSVVGSIPNNNNLFLKTTGAGVVKFGTYTAGSATDSTGYITIKDALGNTRKLMVQA